MKNCNVCNSLKSLKDFYKRSTGSKDVPLNGKHVSGLHVPWNLQVLPKSINIAKFNKLAA